MHQQIFLLVGFVEYILKFIFQSHDFISFVTAVTDSISQTFRTRRYNIAAKIFAFSHVMILKSSICIRKDRNLFI